LAAENAVAQAQLALREALEPLQTIADSLGRKAPGSPAHLRMLYEVAWCSRTVAEADVDGARRQLAQQRLAEVQARLATKLAAGQAPPALLAPEVNRSAVSVRLAEKATYELYRRLIAAGPGTPLAAQARLELAELLLEREDRDGAIKLLAEALTKSPPLDLAERIRLRLADGFLAANDPKSALPHIEAVARNAASPLAAQARYLAGAARIRQQDWAKAIEQLVPFRDQPPLQNVPGISDRALLALGQAYAKAGQWDASRQALEVLTQRFPQSTGLDEAVYGIAWAWQNQKQHDNAVGTYARVIARTAGEVAARSQLQIGLCRIEQKRYPEAENALLAAAFTYGYPECTAQAWCEAARARAEMKEPAGAAKLLRQVIESYPESPWAEVARQRMAEMAAVRNQ
jgi:TolA-binding protein